LDMKQQKSNTFALIGASRTGIALAYHLDQAGHEPVFLWNRSQAGLVRSAKYLRFRNTSTELSQIPRDIGWIIIGVKDDTIRIIAEELSRYISPEFSPKVFHISGAWDASLLDCLKNNGCRTGSFHPLISVPDIETGIREMSRAIFSCEGDLSTDLLGLAHAIGGSGMELSPDQKASVHIAAVFVNNYLTVLIQALKQFASKQEIASADLAKMLEILSRQATENAWLKSLNESLTGPAVRGDEVTIQRHLERLSDFPELKPLYLQFVKLTQYLLKTEE